MDWTELDRLASNYKPVSFTDKASALTLELLAQAKSISPSFLAELGVHDLKRGVGIPYLDIDGQKLEVKRRTTLIAKDGSYWPKGKALLPYGLWKLDMARKEALMVVVEGESDCWALWSMGLPALGIPGANASNVITSECLECIDTIYVNREPGHGGDAFIAGVARKLAQLEFQGKLWELTMPEGVKDPSELLIRDHDNFLTVLAEQIKASKPIGLVKAPVSVNGKHTSRVDDNAIVVYKASSVTPKEVTWLWPNRIPLGKLTTFAGIGGLGKTFVLLDMVARETTGEPWPDKQPGNKEPGQVLFISGEDDVEDTLVPRLIEMKANLDRVSFLKTEVQGKFTLADTVTLSRAYDQMGARTRLIAIDPPTAYLGAVDDHKNADLRGVLTPLAVWAAERGVAIIFNTHINKGSGQKIEAMMRVYGSVAWVNAVRAAFLFSKDSDNPAERLFIGMKCNIGKEQKGLKYRIVETDKLAKIEWLGEVDISADEAMYKKSASKRRVIASVFLEEMFGGKEELLSKAIFDAARLTTVSEDALREAKEDMDIRARQKCGPDGQRNWYWCWSQESKDKWVRPDIA